MTTILLVSLNVPAPGGDGSRENCRDVCTAEPTCTAIEYRESCQSSEGSVCSLITTSLATDGMTGTTCATYCDIKRMKWWVRVDEINECGAWVSGCLEKCEGSGNCTDDAHQSNSIIVCS